MIQQDRVGLKLIIILHQNGLINNKNEITYKSRVFLLRQIWIVKYSTVNGKYLLFLRDFFFRLKKNSIKIATIADCLKKIWKLIKQNKIFDGIIEVIFDDPYLTK